MRRADETTAERAGCDAGRCRRRRSGGGSRRCEAGSHGGPASRRRCRGRRSSAGGSATSSAAAARPRSSRPEPWAATGTPPSGSLPPTSSARSVSASASGRACASRAAAPAATAAAALEPLTAPNAELPLGAVPGSAVTRPTPGASSSGLTLPSKPRPQDENGASVRRRARRRCAGRRSRPARRALVSNWCAIESGSVITGTPIRSSIAIAPGAISRPCRMTASAPAADAQRASVAGSTLARTTAARPATRLVPSWKNAPWLAAEPDGAAGWSSSVPFGGTAPASGTRRSNRHREPGADDDAHARGLAPRVERADSERGGSAGRAADAAERRPGRPVVPRRGHDQGVEPLARRRSRGRAGCR